ncbi:MAG: hypothetical protein ACK2T0_02580, partial [Anaerolineales bacterium]
LVGVLADQAPLTARHLAAWSAGLIAALGWWMPAYAANWGKYPLIAGLAVLPIPLAYLYSARRTRPHHLYLIAGTLLALGTVLLHSRLGIVIGLVMIAFWIARLVSRRLPSTQAWRIVAGIPLCGGAAYLGWLRLDLAGFYTSNWPLLVTLALLLPWDFVSHFQQTLTTLLTLCGMGLLAGLQLPSLLTDISVQWLDRPFVQMGLYLPLAVVGALGVAGFGWKLSGARWAAAVPVIGLSVLILLRTPFVHPLYPDGCCSYVTQDDLRAYEWLSGNVPSDSLVVIAGLRTSTRIIETDAGTWVYAMTGLDTAKRPFDSTLDDLGFLKSISQGRDHVYLYLGGRDMSFKHPNKAALAHAYEVELSSGSTEIVRLKPCPCSTCAY